MRIETVVPGVVMVAGLLASSAHAQHGALAEEIWSQNFCEQAVALAGQRGEGRDALNLVDCRLLNYYQPSYWQCVIAAMKADAGIKLDAARHNCLAQY